MTRSRMTKRTAPPSPKRAPPRPAPLTSFAYRCDNGHRMTSRFELSCCPAMVRGRPCVGELHPGGWERLG